MTPSKKQIQVSKQLNESLDAALRKTGMYDQSPGMLSIHEVQMSPDLLEAKVYLSFFNIQDKDKIWEELEQKKGEIKRQIGNKLRNKLRRIPNITYLEDETIETAFRIEELLKNVDIPRSEQDEEE